MGHGGYADMGMVLMTEKVDQQTLENIVRDLTRLGDAWNYRGLLHPIYLLRDGIPAGAIMSTVRARNAHITMVLVTIMEWSGQLVTDRIVNQIIAFVEHTTNDDDFND
jgi:hypothetical protein